MNFEWLFPTLVAGLCGLDAMVVFQLALARPLVAGTLSGVLLGHPELGLCAGSLVELLWLGVLPVGSVVPPDFTLAAVLTAALALWSHQALPALPWELCLSAALFTSLIPAWLGGLGEEIQRSWQSRLARRTEGAMAQGKSGALALAVFLSLLATLLRSLFMAAFFLLLLPGPLIWLLSKLPLLAAQALSQTFWWALLLGLAVALDQLWERKGLWALLWSFALSSLCLYGLKLAPWQILLLACLCGLALVLSERLNRPAHKLCANPAGKLRKVLPQVALRSFLLQAGWNFERLQNLGFAFAASPGLSLLYPDAQARRRAMLRHLGFFNTHPYLASLILGGSLRLEEQCLESGQDPAAKANTFKLVLMGPLAAMGDALFWATLRPLVAVLAVAVAWMTPVPWWVPLGLLLLCFNLPHLLLRFQGLWQGYALVSKVADYVREMDLQGAIVQLRRGGLVVLGATLAGFGIFRHLASGEGMPFFENFLFVGGGLAMLLLLRLRLRPGLILGLVFLFQWALGFALAQKMAWTP